MMRELFFGVALSAASFSGAAGQTSEPRPAVDGERCGIKLVPMGHHSRCRWHHGNCPRPVGHNDAPHRQAERLREQRDHHADMAPRLCSPVCRILTIASTVVVEPNLALGRSTSLRSTLVGWSKTLASEVARDGVTVNLLLGGQSPTDRTVFLDAAAAEKQGTTSDKIKARKVERKSLPADTL